MRTLKVYTWTSELRFKNKTCSLLNYLQILLYKLTIPIPYSMEKRNDQDWHPPIIKRYLLLTYFMEVMDAAKIVTKETHVKKTSTEH